MLRAHTMKTTTKLTANHTSERGLRREFLSGSFSFFVIQRGKMYSTAFCAFPVAHLAGSIYNTSCDGSQWLETAADRDKAREDVARLTYLHLDKYDIFFGISLLTKQVSP